MPTEAAPISVTPSGQFIGNDGAWSTFNVNVGTPPQVVQLLASTEQPASWVVDSDGCPAAAPDGCTSMRGGAFDASQSKTWFRKDIYQLNEAVNLGYSGNDINGTYGFDTLGLSGGNGLNNVSLDHQVVAEISTPAFYIGSLGLAPQQINFTAPGDSSPSFLSSLKAKGLIPSLSYGYAAGASYRYNGANASLTLGGYDSSRYKGEMVGFNFAPTPMRQLVVGLQSITYSDSNGFKPLLTEGILSLVDSTVPHLWLPQSTCQAFESAFGISWDPLHNLYTLNDSTHEALLKTNPSLTFSIANAVSGGASANITFPYASFDLNATYPLVKNSTRYFPLQRAADDNSYTLGRTFFQEAYMMVNYENSSFALAQAQYDPSKTSHIVAISSNSSQNAASPSATVSSSSGSHGIGSGAIAGIAIAIVLVGIICAVAFFFCLRRRKRKRAHSTAEFHREHRERQEMAMLDDSKERDSSEDGPDPKKPPVGIHVNNMPTSSMSEMDGQDRHSLGSARRPTELPGENFPRSELHTPEPAASVHRQELPSPDPLDNGALRSELSTPEPVWPNAELPTPDPSHELPSPHMSHKSHPSPSLGFTQPGPHNYSGLNSPTQVPIQRPRSLRIDSSDAESGITVGSTGLYHQRRMSDEADTKPVHSDSVNVGENPSIMDSAIPTVAASGPAKRNLPITRARKDVSNDETLESPVLGRMNSDASSLALPAPITPLVAPETSESSQNPVSIAKTTHSLTAPRRVAPKAQRPSGLRPQRFNSTDSETWETRLGGTNDDEGTEGELGEGIHSSNPPQSRFGTVRMIHHRSVSSGEAKIVGIPERKPVGGPKEVEK